MLVNNKVKNKSSSLQVAVLKQCMAVCGSGESHTEAQLNPNSAMELTVWCSANADFWTLHFQSPSGGSHCHFTRQSSQQEGLGQEGCTLPPWPHSYKSPAGGGGTHYSRQETIFFNHDHHRHHHHPRNYNTLFIRQRVVIIAALGEFNEERCWTHLAEYLISSQYYYCIASDLSLQTPTPT